mgnify:CR=1 FL=1
MFDDDDGQADNAGRTELWRKLGPATKKFLMARRRAVPRNDDVGKEEAEGGLHEEVEEDHRVVQCLGEEEHEETHLAPI